MNNSIKKNIVCDLDGTLVKNDITFESLISFIKNKPFNFFWIFVWAFHGRSYIKFKVAEIIDLQIDNYVFDTEILAYLIKEHRNGNNIFIFSGSNQKYVDQISKEIGIFQDAVGSTKTNNLTGKEKLAALETKFNNFDYIGNARSDLVIWNHSQNVICSNNASNRLRNEIKKKYSNYSFIGEKNTFGFNEFFSFIRVHQWVKNVLVFVPMFFTNNYSKESILILIVAFFAFSLLASSTYILNDILDLANDRAHTIKKDRSIAACKISINNAILFAFILFCAALILICNFFNQDFLIILVTYTLLTTTYSLYLKRIICLDLLTLSALYTLRIIAGAFAISVTMSSWLAIFALLFFSSLSSIKRLVEIKNIKNKDTIILGRGYSTDDQMVVKIFGISVGLMSVLFYSIYLSDIYDFSAGLNLSIITIPILIHWMIRLFIKVDRQLILEDPVVFVLRDKTSYVSLIMTFLFFYLGRFY